MLQILQPFRASRDEIPANGWNQVKAAVTTIWETKGTHNQRSNLTDSSAILQDVGHVTELSGKPNEGKKLNDWKLL